MGTMQDGDVDKMNVGILYGVTGKFIQFESCIFIMPDLRLKFFKQHVIKTLLVLYLTLNMVLGAIFFVNLYNKLVNYLITFSYH